MIFPFEEVSEGNTLAVLPYMVPGGGPVKQTVKIATKLPATERLLKFIGGHTEGASVMTSKLTPQQISQLKLLENEGIDLSRLSVGDLEAMRKARINALADTGPSRFELIKQTGNDTYKIQDWLNCQQTPVNLGTLEIKLSDHHVYPEKLLSAQTATNVSEHTYNAAIDFGHQMGKEGFISGANLLSAPKTYNVWKHYPDKILVGNTGTHSNVTTINSSSEAVPSVVQSADELVQATKEGKLAILHEGDIYQLNSASKSTPAKSENFSTVIIDDNGIMHPQWDIKDVFKVGLLPITILSLNKRNDKQ